MARMGIHPKLAIMAKESVKVDSLPRPKTGGKRLVLSCQTRLQALTEIKTQAQHRDRDQMNNKRKVD